MDLTQVAASLVVAVAATVAADCKELGNSGRIAAVVAVVLSGHQYHR